MTEVQGKELSHEQSLTELIIDDTSSQETFCRICREGTSDGDLVSPCNCKGSLAMVHVACLERWLSGSGRNTCELCGGHFELKRTLRYSVAWSVCVWLLVRRHRDAVLLLYARHLRLNVCMLCTTVSCFLLMLYVSVLATDHFSKHEFRHFLPVRWLCVSLLLLVLSVSYLVYAWLARSVALQRRGWYFWWQASAGVRLLNPGGSAQTVSPQVSSGEVGSHSREGSPDSDLSVQRREGETPNIEPAGMQLAPVGDPVGH